MFHRLYASVSVGDEPQLDETNSTLDGKYYDNTEYKCWKFTWEYTEKSTGEADVHESGVDYEWLTELWAQYEKASVMYLYQHDGMWFYISAGHKAYFRKFKKDYGEKFIGTGVLVKEIIGEVE